MTDGRSGTQKADTCKKKDIQQFKHMKGNVCGQGDLNGSNEFEEKNILEHFIFSTLGKTVLKFKTTLGCASNKGTIHYLYPTTTTHFAPSGPGPMIERIP